MTLLYSLIAMTLLFIVALGIKEMTKKPLCAICIAIAATWITLFTLYKTGSFHNSTLLALLMGQSISGLFYLLKDKVPGSLRLFTLPFFLSLTTVFYALISGDSSLLAFAFVAVALILAWLLFAYRNDPGKKSAANAVMDCCGGKQ